MSQIFLGRQNRWLNNPIFASWQLQPQHNSATHYLPILENFSVHKLCVLSMGALKPASVVRVKTGQKVTLFIYDIEPLFKPICHFSTVDMRQNEACIARTGGGVRMGSTPARRSLAAASRAGQAGGRLRRCLF